MGMEVFLQKEPKIPGTHNIGAALSGPRIVGGKLYGHEAMSEGWHVSCLQNKIAQRFSIFK